MNSRQILATVLLGAAAPRNSGALFHAPSVS